MSILDSPRKIYPEESQKIHIALQIDAIGWTYHCK